MPTLALVTRDRARMVERALASLARGFNPGSARVVVFDDSEPEGAEALRAITEAAPEQLGGVELFGRAERARLDGPRGGLETVEGVQRNAGVNRNAALLSCEGPVVFLDDDVLCEGVITGKGGRRSRLPDPTRMRWFPEGERLPASRPVDLVGAHLSALEHAPVSQVGQLGDAATGDEHWQLHLRGPVGAHARKNWSRVRTCRRVLRACDGLVLSEGTLLIAMSMGLRGGWQPPFLSAGRNIDGLFAAMRRVIAPEGLIAHLPLALRHEPPTTRLGSEASLLDGGLRFEITELVGRALRGARSLPEMGARLMQLAVHPDLAGFVRRSYRQGRLDLARGLSQLLEEHGEDSPEWAEDAQRSLHILLAAAASEAWPRIEELEERGEDEELRALSAQLWAWGELFTSWKR